jgi:hypothetical protein
MNRSGYGKRERAGRAEAGLDEQDRDDHRWNERASTMTSFAGHPTPARLRAAQSPIGSQHMPGWRHTAI